MGKAEVYQVFLEAPSKKLFLHDIVLNLRRKRIYTTEQNICRVLNEFVKHREIFCEMVFGEEYTDPRTKEKRIIKKGRKFWLNREYFR